MGAEEILDWSPDSKWLAVCDERALSLLSLETGQRQPLTSPPGTMLDVDPAFSPDGKNLVFARHSSAYVSHLYSVPLGDGYAVNPLPKPSPQRHQVPDDCRVRARPVLGGLHHEYSLGKQAA